MFRWCWYLHSIKKERSFEYKSPSRSLIYMGNENRIGLKK